MVSIYKVYTTETQKTNNKNSTPIRPKTHTQQLQTTDNNLLASFLSLMGKNNVYSISFGSGIEQAIPGWKHQPVGVPQDGTWIPDHLKEKIHFEATNHIRGIEAWPKIKNINAWMVTAETQTFMPVGGLAQVAVDLPNSFNEHFEATPENEMTIVTPMYLNAEENGQGTNKLIAEDGKLFYKYKNNKIQVTKTASIDVPIFDEWKNGGEMTNLPVNIYEGKTKGTKYIFFDREDIFNIDPKGGQGAGNAYVDNKYGYNETIRFPFFSKCVYEYMKQVKENPSQFEQKAPNIVIMNDWHTGSLAPMMKYLAMCEHDHKEIKESTAQYMKKTPTLFIAHNLAYQGSVWDNDKFPNARAKTLGTIFGKFTKNIMENSRSWDSAPFEKKNALFNSDGNVNQGMMGLCLADRVIPVSEHFGEELLLSPSTANGMIELLNERERYETLTPITNGYSKNRVEPSLGHVDAICKNAERDTGIKGLALRPYTEETLKQIKPQNKVEIFNLVNKLIDRERNSAEANWNSLDTANSGRKYMIFKPNQTDLSDIKDINKVPVMTFVGRVVEQKGMHNIFKEAYLKFAEDYTKDQALEPSQRKYKDWDIPVVIAGGSFGEADTPIYKQLEDLKRELYTINPKFAERFVLFRGFCNTNLLAMGSDFFLIPSNFEPCGLVQMEVMAKGVLPIATATGGLVSTIDQYKTGFLSTVHYDNANNILHKDANIRHIPSSNAMAYKDAMESALLTYFKKPNQLLKMQRTAMLKDFSWIRENGALDKYVALMKTGRFEPKQVSYNEAPDVKTTTPYKVPDMTPSKYHSHKKTKDPTAKKVTA